MFKTLFIAGPPFDVSLWKDVSDRLNKHGYDCSCVPLLVDGEGTLPEEADRVARQIAKETQPVIIIAHGSAIPVAIEAEALTAPAGMVLSNGVLGRIDPMTRAMCTAARMPSVMFNQLFSPQLALRWLSSSAGLRRAVVNPYVMDPDTTVAICGPFFKDRERRNRLQHYLRSLGSTALKPPGDSTPTLLCWGDSDPLNPLSSITLNDSVSNHIDRDVIPGGKYLHPVERPWELADKIVSWAEKTLTTT